MVPAKSHNPNIVATASVVEVRLHSRSRGREAALEACLDEARTRKKEAVDSVPLARCTESLTRLYDEGNHGLIP